MTLDSDALDARVLHRVLDGLRRLPDQRTAPEARDDADDAAPPREGGDGVLPRRRRP